MIALGAVYRAAASKARRLINLRRVLSGACFVRLRCRDWGAYYLGAIHRIFPYSSSYSSNTSATYFAYVRAVHVRKNLLTFFTTEGGKTVAAPSFPAKSFSIRGSVAQASSALSIPG